MYLLNHTQTALTKINCYTQGITQTVNMKLLRLHINPLDLQCKALLKATDVPESSAMLLHTVVAATPPTPLPIHRSNGSGRL